MGFPGTWMTESENAVYRVIPKCACSSIGQILYYSDHGRYFDGDIHDAKDGIHKWAFDHSQPRIEERVQDDTFTFTCVRNPWSRILSSFFDKIAGIQRSGNRYRANTMIPLMRRYGVDIEGDFDQIGHPLVRGLRSRLNLDPRRRAVRRDHIDRRFQNRDGKSSCRI